jgi:hypothetical protein
MAGWWVMTPNTKPICVSTDLDVLAMAATHARGLGIIQVQGTDYLHMESEDGSRCLFDVGRVIWGADYERLMTLAAQLHARAAVSIRGLALVPADPEPTPEPEPEPAPEPTGDIASGNFDPDAFTSDTSAIPESEGTSAPTEPVEVVMEDEEGPMPAFLRGRQTLGGGKGRKGHSWAPERVEGI